MHNMCTSVNYYIIIIRYERLKIVNPQQPKIPSVISKGYILKNTAAYCSFLSLSEFGCLNRPAVVLLTCLFLQT